MHNISVFFNSRTVNKDSFGFADVPVAFGDWCLTPVRCLFNGNKVTVSTRDGIVQVDHEKEYAQENIEHAVYNLYGFGKPKRTYTRVILAIVFLVPGVIIGSAFKGLGYLAKPIRDRHNLAVQHFTPVTRTIGSQEGPLDIAGIIQKLAEQRRNNHLHQTTETLIIYAQAGTQIKEDPGIRDFDPKKLILVGTQMIHGPSDSLGGCMDENLDRTWENRRRPGVMKDAVRVEGSFAVQWKVRSIEAAIKDVPPRRSFFSFERYKRIYVV